MSFWQDKSGNFGVLTALLIVPLLGAAGLAIDFAEALECRTELFQAADAAAIGSVAENSPALAAAMRMSADGPIKDGEDDARNLFFSQKTSRLGTLPVNLTVTVNREGNYVKSAVNFSTSVPLSFMQILGKSTIDISGTASAEYKTATFMDFYILLDNTPSMGVGATPDDMKLLQAATPDQCAFACHEVNNPENYYLLAKRLKIKTRIDVVRQATQSLSVKAIQMRSSPNQYRMGVYTFGERAEDANLKIVSNLTSDLKKVGAYTAGIDLMSIPYQLFNNDQQTSFDDAFSQMNSIVTAPGDGRSASNPEKILFFVSDGVGDSDKPEGCSEPTAGDRCQEPINVNLCERLKSRGVKIAVLYTTYLPLPSNDWYNAWIAPFQSEIPKRMRDCASDGLFFEVSPTQGIEEAMNALFMRVIRAPRLAG